MIEYSLVSDHAIRNFTRLSVTDLGTKTDFLQAGDDFGIAIDQAGRPVRVLSRSGSGPAIQIAAMAPMDRATWDDIAKLLVKGVPALVVMDQDHYAGILTARTVADYARANLAVNTGGMSDAPSDLTVLGPPGTAVELTMICSTCGHANTVPTYIEGKTMCVNGHVLSLWWD